MTSYLTATELREMTPAHHIRVAALERADVNGDAAEAQLHLLFAIAKSLDVKQPVEYTDPEVLTDGIRDGWADVETDPSLIDWRARKAVAAIPFQVVAGRPVNPCAKTKVQRGRNDLGRWGENLMADAVVTALVDDHLYLLMVERKDGHGWAVPGGSVEVGETPAQAAGRELEEETDLGIADDRWTVGRPVYVPDPRASDEAWAVTVPSYVQISRLEEVRGADDAVRAEWIRADSYAALVADVESRFGGEVFSAHRALLAETLR